MLAVDLPTGLHHSFVAAKALCCGLGCGLPNISGLDSQKLVRNAGSREEVKTSSYLKARSLGKEKGVPQECTFEDRPIAAYHFSKRRRIPFPNTTSNRRPCTSCIGPFSNSSPKPSCPPSQESPDYPSQDAGGHVSQEAIGAPVASKSCRKALDVLGGKEAPAKHVASRSSREASDVRAKLLPHVKRQWRLIAQAWVCTLVSLTALLLVIPRIGTLSSLLSNGDLRGVLRLAGVTMALIGVRCVAQYGQDVWLWEAALDITSSVRKQVYGHVQNLGLSYFEGGGETAAGDTAYRLTAEADQTGALVFAFLQRLVPSALQLAAMLAKMLLLSPFLSGATFAVAPLMSLLIARLGERVSRLSRSSQNQIAEMSAHVNEVLPAMLVVKAHAAEGYEGARFGALADAHRSARMAFQRQQALFSPAITLVYAATVVSLFTAGTWAIAHGRFSGEKMVAFLTSLVLLIEPIQAVGSAYNEIKQGQPAVERVFEVLDTRAEVDNTSSSNPDLPLAGDIVFDSVSFSYRDRPVIRHVSFRIRRGETVAVVGPSGSGKTTLVKLLLRLYEPDSGSIHIGAVPIRSVPLRTLRRQLGFVPQDNILFSGTVAGNIAYGVPPYAIDMAAVERAAKRAHADEFVRGLSGGYEAVIGERGSTLSGGQKQRLAIARAIYHEPPCLILDEATSALDIESEVLVRDALRTVMADKTVIIIAHKLETVQGADRILFMEQGLLVEQGTHVELLERGGRYASFFHTQEIKDVETQQSAPVTTSC